MKLLAVFLFLTTISQSGPALSREEKPLLNRRISAMGVKAKLIVRELDPERVEIAIATTKGEGGRDTIRGRRLTQLFVNGARATYYFGRFGGAKLPMLIIGVGSVDRIQDSKILAYEVTKAGGLIGQRVLVDVVEEKIYTNTTSGGRYRMASLDTKLGAIYSIAYEDARYGDFITGFEKLRLRQWEPRLNCFIEIDQGFLRDKRNQLIEAFKFHQYTDRGREQVFLANVTKPEPRARKQVTTREDGPTSITKASLIK